jgi:cytosine deaminase
MNLEGYGVAPGCNADLVVLQAADTIEAIRLRPNRLFVLRRGKVLAKSAPQVSTVMFGESETAVDFTRANLNG